FLLTALCVLACCRAAQGQIATTVLEIEVENYVNYFNDVADYSKLATDPNKTAVAQVRNFAQSIGVADIVSVNGEPAKGIFTDRRIQLALAVNPTAGQAIADAARSNIHDRYFEILKPDGTLIGTIVMTGRGGGSPPPGAPSAILNADFTVVGGTGAFLGVRGQAGGTRDPRPEARSASMSEDPGNRRMHGGGQRRFVLHLIPLSRPEVVVTTDGPAVVHAGDFTLVTAAKPARSGEILSLVASHLGPTGPGVDPGQPFPASPRQIVNSPMAVTVNGAAADVLYAGGYPGTTNAYQVNFRLPSGIRPGLANLQLTVAWIAGPEVKIAVQ
ncbi:MAG: hypothetical protein AAB225_20895, partial [Acidobacteriota bacterium]